MTPAEVAVGVQEDGYQLVSRRQGRSWQGQVANDYEVALTSATVEAETAFVQKHKAVLDAKKPRQ